MKRKLFIAVTLLSTMSLFGQNAKVHFLPSDKGTTFGFDTLVYAEADYSYPTVKVVGGKYAPNAWISIECGKKSLVNLVSSKLPEETTIKLINSNKQEVLSAGFDRNKKEFFYELKSTSEKSEDYYFLTETLTKKKGKVTDTLCGLSVVSYPMTKSKIILVPTGNLSVSEEYSKNLQEQLNVIYHQAVAEWEISIASPFNPANSNDLTIIDNDKYSDVMKSFIDAYKKVQKPEKNVTYIFVLEKTKSELDYFMQKGKPFGFCTMQSSPRNIAHMLGHGVFKLDNIYSITSKPKGSTDNLMDEGNGVKLIKSQWDQIH